MKEVLAATLGLALAPLLPGQKDAKSESLPHR